MPIVLPVFDPNAPLSQGDILKGVPLFNTGKPGTAAPGAVQYKAPYCLVISRPCVTAHKDRVVVAAVERLAKSRPIFEDFDEAKEYYEDIRDGKSSPDVFYLGQLDGEQGSFCARLDALHTIELPTESDPARQAFITATRVACLDTSFARDLHQRLFRAFASLGFDDQGWYSTDDLKVLVTLGEVAIARAHAEHLEALARALTGETQAYNKPTEKTHLANEEAKKKKELEKLEQELAPLRAEFERRKAVPLPGTQIEGTPTGSVPNQPT